MSRASATIYGPVLALLLAAPLTESFSSHALQAAEITSVTVDRTSVTAGETVRVTFTTSGAFELGNDFLVQLSSSSGSFTGPTSLPALQTGDGMMEVRIPCETPTGGGYRIRLLSTAPRDTAVTPTPFSVSGRSAPTIVASNTSLCEGDSATIDAGPGFASYTWSTGATTRVITVSTAGRYQVVVTDAGGCALTSEPVDIVVSLRPVPTITRTGNVLEAPPGFASYRWSTGATGRTLTLQQPGEYRVTVVDANGCAGISAPFNATLSSVAVRDPAVRSGLSIFPDGDAVTIRSVDGAEGEFLVTIADVTGRVVERREGRVGLSIPMAAHPAGFYLIAVEMGKERRVEGLMLGR
jgi:hypothetical protein